MRLLSDWWDIFSWCWSYWPFGQSCLCVCIINSYYKHTLTALLACVCVCLSYPEPKAISDSMNSPHSLSTSHISISTKIMSNFELLSSKEPHWICSTVMLFGYVSNDYILRIERGWRCWCWIGLAHVCSILAPLENSFPSIIKYNCLHIQNIHFC